jgi:hypothetical protein
VTSEPTAVSILTVSFVVLLTTALLGGVLAALHLRETMAPPSWSLGALHGLIGMSGLITLLIALRGPPRGEAMGVGGFGRAAAVLLALALLAGVAILVARLRDRQVPGLAVGLHATIAVSGLVILAAYVLIG